MTRATLLHFEESTDSSGYFPQLARWRDRERYRMLFGTLLPMEPELRRFMEGEGVPCFSCQCRSRAEYGLGLWRLRGLLRRERVEVLHTHLFEPSVVGLAAGALAGTPTRVLTRHYSDYHTRIGKRWHMRLDQLCTRLAHAVIAVSRHTAEHLLSAEGAPAEKVSVVWNGVAFDRIRPARTDAAGALRAELGLGDAHVMLVLARLHPEKGHSYLFRALPRLRQTLKRPVVALLAGEGPFEAAYRAEVAALGCEEMVRFLGFRRDAADLIMASDVVVLPSVAEAFGIALVEALYLGTPVVATTAGGIPEIVDDGLDGLLVPPADSDALERALFRVLSDDALRKRLAGAGREKVIRRFSFERMVRDYEALYERLRGAGVESRAAPAASHRF